MAGNLRSLVGVFIGFSQGFGGFFFGFSKVLAFPFFQKMYAFSLDVPKLLFWFGGGFPKFKDQTT